MAEDADTRTILGRFEDAAARIGRFLAVNDGDRAEVSLLRRNLEAAYAWLVAKGEQRQIEILLGSEDPYVRLQAAEVFLLTDEARAIEMLEGLREMPAPRNLAANAKRILTPWKTGLLFPRSWPRQ